MSDELRREFAALAESGGEACVNAKAVSQEAIWQAVRGELPRAETRRIVDHCAHCASCAESWRLARELGANIAHAPARSFSWRAAWLPLAAAVLLALLILPGGPDIPPPEPGYRNEGRTGPVSLIEDAGAQSRDDCTLRWSPGPDGTRYEVWVATPELTPVASAKRLLEPEYRVPAEALAGQPAGSRLLWQVTAHYPDGRVEASPTYSLTLR